MDQLPGVAIMTALDYCKNETDEEFERKVLIDFLGNLRRFDIRTLENKPTMAKARRRVVFGAMETRKLLELEKVKAIIVARNLADDVLLDEDFKYCIENKKDVPVIYCLSRKQLGTTLLNPSSRIGIVGVLKLDGVHEIWNEILGQLKKLQEDWIRKYEKEAYVLECAYYGHLDLLKRKFDLSELRDINCGCFLTGKTPLIVAVERDHREVVQFLIEHCGADQDIPDFALNRPQHVVKSAVVAHLLDDCQKINAAGLLPIESAIINERIEVLKEFLANKGTAVSIEKMLFAATCCKSDRSIRFLHMNFAIQRFEDFKNSKGNNLLMESVENGAYEVFKYFIGTQFNIDKSYRNVSNVTILDIARRVGNVGILRYLEKHVQN